MIRTRRITSRWPNAPLFFPEKIDIKLTESFAMHPGASVSGLYFSHPDAKYFGVGQIARDQVTDYAARRSENVSAIEKRLGPNLGYEPQTS